MAASAGMRTRGPHRFPRAGGASDGNGGREAVLGEQDQLSRARSEPSSAASASESSALSQSAGRWTPAHSNRARRSIASACPAAAAASISATASSSFCGASARRASTSRCGTGLGSLVPNRPPVLRPGRRLFLLIASGTHRRDMRCGSGTCKRELGPNHGQARARPGDSCLRLKLIVRQGSAGQRR